MRMVMPTEAVNGIPKINCNALSHAGKYREDNQDSVRFTMEDDPRLEAYAPLYGIADGMGGYSHGGIASTLALETLFDTFYGSDPRQVAQNMRSGVQSANLSVYQRAQNLGVRRMGTTLTAVAVIGNRLHLAHVGDSRAYLVRDGQATCLTNDHTAVGDLVRMRVLSPDKVRKHNQRSVLNKCLGIDLFVQPDISQTTIQQDDVIIMCSDGVWSVVEDNEFAEQTSKSSGVGSLSQSLVDLALDRESDDNVSVIAVHAERLGEVAADEGRGWKMPG